MHFTFNFNDDGNDEMKDVIESRLKAIDENIKSHDVFQHMIDLGKEIFEGVKDFDILRKMEINSNDMTGGSISFFIKTFPETFFIKLWHDSGNFYLSLFRKVEGMFDQQMTGTFNESGILTCNDMDDAEEKILDFIANEIYSRKHKKVLTYKD